MEQKIQNNTSRNTVLFKTVEGVSIGAIGGFIANALVEAACASIVAKKLRLPSIEQALNGSLTTIAISMGVGGYRSYKKAVNEKSNSRKIQL